MSKNAIVCKKFVHRFSIRNMPVCLLIFGEKLKVELCLSKRAAIWQMHHIFIGKVPQSLERCIFAERHHNPRIALLYKNDGP